mmetsp:Transcript_118722/g.221932  ORF Transcript_118722/g.221932 Transcript_118722/m.221932 type:complete len:759 (+) Transcript_118722:67-2343(+)
MKASEASPKSNGQAKDTQVVPFNGADNVSRGASTSAKVDDQLLQDWPFLNSSGELPLGKKLLWALPFLGWMAVSYHKRTYMKLFYVDDYPKASLGYIALFSVLAVLVDAFSDPAMANFSDNARFRRWGRRRPFILGGGFATVIIFTLSYFPALPAGVGASVWFGVFHIGTKLCDTVTLIPLEAWGAELSPYYKDRTSIFMWQQVFVSIGILLGSALPGMASQMGGQDCADGQPGCVGFPVSSFVFGLIFFGALVVLIFCGRERSADRLPPANVSSWSEDGVVPTLIITWLNTPFKYLIMSATVKAFGSNLPFAVLPFMARGLLGDACMTPTRIISMLAAVHIVTRIIFLPVWLLIGRRLGKFKALLAFQGCLAVSQSLFVFLKRDTGDCQQLYVAAGLAAIWGASYAGIFFLQSIMADIVDYDELLTGKRRESQYMMIIDFLPKFVEVLSEAVPFLLLAHFGYKRPSVEDDVPDPEQPAAVVWTLRLSFSLVPAVFLFAGFLCLLKYPKEARTEEAHHKLMIAITEKHRKGLSAEDPWFLGRTLQPPPKAGEQDGLLSHFFPAEIDKMIWNAGETAPSFTEVKQTMLCWIATGAIIAVPGVVLVVLGWEDLGDDLGASLSPLGIILLGISALIIWFHMTRYRALQALEHIGTTQEQLEERLNFLCRFTREPEPSLKQMRGATVELEVPKCHRVPDANGASEPHVSRARQLCSKGEAEPYALGPARRPMSTTPVLLGHWSGQSSEDSVKTTGAVHEMRV